MAGTYPDVPAPRIAFDRDGSIAVRLTSGALYESTLTQSDIDKFSNESEADYYHVGTGWVAILFPTPITLHASLFMKNRLGARGPEYSTDTTDGADGSWTAIPNVDLNTTPVDPFYRDNIVVHDPVITGVKAVRYGNSGGSSHLMPRVYAIHLYGFYETARDLEIWDPVANAVAGGALFDFGDVSQSGVTQQEFRVRNNAATEATGVTLSFATLTPGYDGTVAWFDFSSDGGTTWSATLNIGDIPATSTSSEVLARMTIPGDAPLGLTAVRIQAEQTVV